MRKFLVLFVLLATFGSAHAALNSFLSIWVVEPMASVSIAGETALIRYAAPDGNPLRTKAVSEDDVRDEGFAGSIINAIIVMPELVVPDALIADGVEVPLDIQAVVSLKGRVPVLTASPEGLAIATIEARAPARRPVSATLHSLDLNGHAAEIEALVTGSTSFPVSLIQEEDYRDSGFAGSVVSIVVDRDVALDAIGHKSAMFPLEEHLHLAGDAARYIVLVAPEGLVVATVALDEAM